MDTEKQKTEITPPQAINNESMEQRYKDKAFP